MDEHGDPLVMVQDFTRSAMTLIAAVARDNDVKGIAAYLSTQDAADLGTLVYILANIAGDAIRECGFDPLDVDGNLGRVVFVDDREKRC